MTLASPGLLETTSRIDAKLSLLASAKPLKSGARVHLHALTSEVIATVNLLDGKQVEPGSEAFARLRLSAPLLLVPGDRFIIRQFSPVITVGGGVVLDAFPLKRVVPAQRLEFLKILARDSLESSLLARIERRGPDGIRLPQLIRESGESAGVLEQATANLQRTKAISRHGELLLEIRVLHRLSAELVKLVFEFHSKNPLAPGISKEALRDQARITTNAFDAGLAFSVQQKALALSGDLVHLPGRGVVMKDEEAESRRAIEQAFSSAGLKVPALKDVLAGLRIDKARAQKIVTLLLRDKILIKVSDDLVFHHSALSALRSTMQSEKQRSPKIDVARFKDLTGVSRKYAIPLLEYLDRERITRRVGDERIIV
jgi:selenocysteine-specific elongation factor